MTKRSNGYGLGLKNAVQTTFHENAQLCTPPPNVWVTLSKRATDTILAIHTRLPELI